MLSLSVAAALAVVAAGSRLESSLARRDALARLDALARQTDRVALGALDPTLSLRVRTLGPLLASWETVGGCGAGGATFGTGVKWIGHSTSGGLFQVVEQGNYVHLLDQRGRAIRSHPGDNFILTSQITTEATDKWIVGTSIPLVYKYYYDWNQVGGDLSNGGLGDISALVTRKLGPINATTLTALVGFPTGTYRAAYKGTPLSADAQLGFGRVTGGLMLDHTLDQTWGLVVLGGAAGYRGGTNSVSNYRAPSASLWSYWGYFLGPFVPAAGLTLTGFTRQDTTGGFGETLNAPVCTAALNGSIEWSNDLVAILVGATVPYALRGETWGASGRDFGWLPWTVAVGLSVSPF
jgi:hypothetical protein